MEGAGFSETSVISNQTTPILRHMPQKNRGREKGKWHTVTIIWKVEKEGEEGGNIPLQVMRSVKPHGMKGSPLWEAGSRSAVQLILQIVCNMQSRYGFYSIPTVIWTEYVEYSTQRHLLNIHFTNILWQSLPSGTSSSGSPATT